MNENYHAIRKKMEKEKISALVTDTFIRYYDKYIQGEKGKLSAAEIKAPDHDSVISFNHLENGRADDLKKVAVLKLNGGLGTSMGLKKAKSLLPVKGDQTFLDIIVQQIFQLRKKTGVRIPLIFMDSFNTQEDTLNHLKKYPDLHNDHLPLDFVQNKFPKIRLDNGQPLEMENESLNWNPPGHGDLYTCLAQEGLVDQMLQAGIEVLFVSNADNLGAVPDEKILSYMLMNEIPFIMEVCPRTEMDKKGGHLAQFDDGRLVLREVAQCPDDETEEFQNIDKYRFFNTNNLWISLPALKEYLTANQNIVNLPLIINPKKVEGIGVIQLETAMGSAVSLFKGAKAVLVNRDRFIPVKKTLDMLVVWSDVYGLDSEFHLVTTREQLPLVELDPLYFETIDQLRDRCAAHVPSLLYCDSLKIAGDVTFTGPVTFIGDIALKTDHSIHLQDISLSSVKKFLP